MKEVVPGIISICCRCFFVHAILSFFGYCEILFWCLNVSIGDPYVLLLTSEFDHAYFMLDFYVFLALFGRFHMRYLQSLHHTHHQYLAIFTSSARHPPSSTPHRLVFLSHSVHKKHACMAAFTSPHPSSHPCSNIRQAHPPHAGMAVHGHTKLPSLHPNPATSMQTPIFPYPSPCQSHLSPPSFSLCPRITITHTSMRASPLQWLGAGSSQASLPFPTGLAGAAIGVRRCCFGSGCLSLGCRRRPARRPL